MGNSLGIDFGTSNTAASMLVNGQPQLITLEGGKETIPTAIFLDFGARKMRFGNEAVACLIDGDEGRFIRALKRILGTPLFREQRQLLNERMSFLDVVAQFIKGIKQQAEAQSGERFTHVLSGRPVRFHPNDPARDKLAQDDLAECYHRAGFKRVDFMFEPEAAALAHHGNSHSKKRGLVVDIGGGTSDFTLFEGGRVLASHGVRIGGTDFDRALSIAHVMPQLGMGHTLKATIGNATHIAPVSLFKDLATWEKIAFLYTADNRHAAKDMARHALSPPPFERLSEVLELELGHEIAFAVETAKIEANSRDAAVDLSFVKRGWHQPLTSADLMQSLETFANDIRLGAVQTLKDAGQELDSVDEVIFVGGSSLLNIVQFGMRAQFPRAEMVQAEAFAAVANGLAIGASRLSR